MWFQKIGFFFKFLFLDFSFLKSRLLCLLVFRSIYDTSLGSRDIAMGIICEVEDGGIGYSSSWIGYDILFYTRAPPPSNVKKQPFLEEDGFPYSLISGAQLRLQLMCRTSCQFEAKSFLVFAEQQQNLLDDDKSSLRRFFHHRCYFYHHQHQNKCDHLRLL